MDDSKLMGEVRIKLEKLAKEDFNPWAVSDASVFLRYCCPECDFKCRKINNFSEHALQKHDRAKTLFSERKLHKDLLLSSYNGLNEEIPQDFVKTELNDPKSIESTDEEAFAVYDEPKRKRAKKRKRKGALSEREVAKFNEFVNQEDFVIPEPNSKCQKIGSILDISQENIDPLEENDSIEVKKYKWGGKLHSGKKCMDCLKMIHPAAYARHVKICMKNIKEKKEEGKKHKHSAIQIESEPSDLVDKKEISKNQKARDTEDVGEDITLDFDSMYRIDIENNEGDDVTFLIEDSKPKELNPLPKEELQHVTKVIKVRKQKLSKSKSEELTPLPKEELPLVAKVKKYIRKDRTNLSCIHCNEFVGTPTNYHEHAKLMHPEVQKLICDQCGFDTPVKEKLKQHMECVHKIYGKPVRIQCEHCDLKFQKGAKMQIHVDAIHPDCGLDKSFSCEYCGDMFIFRASVVKHKWQCKHQPHREEYLKRIAIHGRKSGIRTKRDPDAQNCGKSNKIVRPIGTTIICDYCDTTFERVSSINSHYELFHPNMPKILPGLKILRCGSCEKEFFNSTDLEIHESIQHGIVQQGKKVCPDCKKPYLNRHKCDKEKTELGSVTCQKCGKVLAHEGSLKKHIETVHMEKKFDCPHCDKKWSSASNLAHHIKQAHQPATCELCNNKCSTFNELKRHKVLVHGIMNGAWLCQLCPKSVFFSERTYELHLKKNHKEC